LKLLGAPADDGGGPRYLPARRFALYTELSQLIRLCIDGPFEIFDPKDAPAGSPISSAVPEMPGHQDARGRYPASVEGSPKGCSCRS
jgi:hypothetical protein